MSSKELTGASTIPIILSVLSEGENYGYAIIKQVKELSKGKLEWSEPMLYPVLHKLEKKGLISSQWKAGENGRRRKYYQITKAGKKAQEQEIQQWKLINGMLNKLWKPHLS